MTLNLINNFETTSNFRLPGLQGCKSRLLVCKMQSKSPNLLNERGTFIFPLFKGGYGGFTNNGELHPFAVFPVGLLAGKKTSRYRNWKNGITQPKGERPGVTSSPVDYRDHTVI